MQQATTYRVLNRDSGYDRYDADASSEGYPNYSKTSFFYLPTKEIEIVYSKSETGLCSNYIRYGTGNWAQIRTSVHLMINKGTSTTGSSSYEVLILARRLVWSRRAITICFGSIASEAALCKVDTRLCV
jgi:hypothetical protein